MNVLVNIVVHVVHVINISIKLVHGQITNTERDVQCSEKRVVLELVYQSAYGYVSRLICKVRLVIVEDDLTPSKRGQVETLKNVLDESVLTTNHGNTLSYEATKRW